ncbi:MAG: hypothetical protein PHI63_05005 [Patescibacteria group bacterium]|nr:hypothetical protein [Patescibacteria group bacterium]
MARPKERYTLPPASISVETGRCGDARGASVAIGHDAKGGAPQCGKPDITEISAYAFRQFFRRKLRERVQDGALG